MRTIPEKQADSRTPEKAMSNRASGKRAGSRTPDKPSKKQVWSKSAVRWMQLCLAGMFLLGMAGCGRVEPEKRAYPMTLGIDFTEGQYRIFLEMASLQEESGQSKEGPGEAMEQGNILLIEGNTKEEILDEYNMTQEKYLDIGHLKAIVFSQNVTGQTEIMREILDGLEAEEMVGNSPYAFWTEDMELLMRTSGNQVESLGDFLAGLYENRAESVRQITLKKVFQLDETEGYTQYIPYLKVTEDEIVASLLNR